MEIKMHDHTFLYHQIREGLILLQGSPDCQFSIPEFGQTIYKHEKKDIHDIVATEEELLIYTDLTIDDLIQTLNKTPLRKSNAQNYILPIWLEPSDDLAKYCQIKQLSLDDFSQEISKLRLTFKMYGFMPGFCYFGGLPSRFHIRRKSSPDLIKNENTLAIGGLYIGMYSLPSPAGWYTLGRCPIPLLNTDYSPPVQMEIGASITFKLISYDEFESLASKSLSIKEYFDYA